MRKYILSFLLIFLLSSPALSQQALQKIRINDFSGGQDSNSLSDSIKINQGSSVKNAIIDKPGKLIKRKGQDLFVEDLGSTAFTGIGRYDPDASTSYMMAASTVSVIRATTASSAWTTVNSGKNLANGYDTEFVQAKGLLFIMNGQDYTAKYDGSTFTKLTGWAAGSPPTATTGAWLRNYLFLAGQPANDDWVFFSNNLEPEIFSAGDIVKINTGDGQKIQKLEPFKLNELIVYKERSIFNLDITGSTPLSDWTVQPVSKSIGTVAPRSVVNLGNDQWFLSSNPIAIRSLVRSEFDKILVDLVSRPIQDIFDGTGDVTINTAQIEKAAAVLYDNKYIIAIPTGSSTVNNTVLVYDFVVGGWFVIDGWYPSAWQVFDERLFYIDANDGRVIETLTGTTGDFAEGPTFIDASSAPTVAVDFEFISKTFDFDNPENFKQLDSIELEFGATGNYNGTLFINLDENGFQDVGNIDLAGNAITLPVTLPFTLTSDGIARKTYQLQQYGEFKKMQFKVRQNGVSESAQLQRITIFADPKAWRRE